MNRSKAYRNSLLSTLCIISWFVIVFRIFKSAIDESAVREFILTCLITIVIGIIGGIMLLFVAMLKKRTLMFSFVYNLFGTLNIVVGFIAMTLPTISGQPSPYIISASLVIGIVMYKTIYSRNRPTVPK